MSVYAVIPITDCTSSPRYFANLNCLSSFYVRNYQLASLVMAKHESRRFGCDLLVHMIALLTTFRNVEWNCGLLYSITGVVVITNVRSFHWALYLMQLHAYGKRKLRLWQDLSAMSRLREN